MEHNVRLEQSKRLQQARQAAGFRTAKEAAERFHWNYETYAQHENGNRGISRSAKRYARAFKVSEAWLLTNTGPGPGEDAANIEHITAVYYRIGQQERENLVRVADSLDLAAEARRRREKEASNPENPDEEE